MGNRSTSSKVKVKENLTESCLIWLDASVNSSTENVNAQKQFRRSFKNLLTFDDEDCLRHIHSLSKRDRIILIVSGRFGRIIVPKVAKLRQIISIYVYCQSKKKEPTMGKTVLKS
ncbi:unnamed protein product [Rotaria magnacalcarata]|uniref:Uncharacterized protein n=1 Tax=Rotaria magnacalcarata TaxID=392030 RepID=A0A8S2QYC3_9BILA|nr:unnamed protein product [Rotaria magnacalcarata]